MELKVLRDGYLKVSDQGTSVVIENTVADYLRARACLNLVNVGAIRTPADIMRYLEPNVFDKD